MKCRKDTIIRMRLALANFSIEYMNDLDQAEKERETIQRAKESGEMVCFVATGESNAEVMLQCMRDMRKAIAFMKDTEHDIENWQLAGINAMFDQCNADGIVPFDIGTAVCGILGTQFYE